MLGHTELHEITYLTFAVLILLIQGIVYCYLQKNQTKYFFIITITSLVRFESAEPGGSLK